MSLEAVLTENNNLLRELISLWKTGAAPAPAPTPADKPQAKAAKTEMKPAAETKAEPEAKAEPATAGVTYDQIKPLIIKVNTTKGREVATALLAEFDVARGPDLKAEQFAAFLARANEVLA